jgi:hypothetical protein
MAELDFHTASIDDIRDIYFAEGCVLLRGFVDADKLTALTTALDPILEQTDALHTTDRDMRKRGLLHFHDYLFETRHHELVKSILGPRYRVANDSNTRRIDAFSPEGGFQPPLEPHLDSFFHSFKFTINFWIPFRQCGLDAPSLGVVCAPAAEVVAFADYDGAPEWDGGALVWNYPNFRKAPFALEDLRVGFGTRIYTPQYGFGDAMMLSNWTLHFTHSTPAMTARRSNVELRFIADFDVATVLEGVPLWPWWRRLRWQMTGSSRGEGKLAPWPLWRRLGWRIARRLNIKVLPKS